MEKIREVLFWTR